jgi:hypothetical protein
VFHFFKRDKVVVDCFTNIPSVYDNCKISHGAHYFPDWWKETPKYIDNYNTIKSCRGFIDYYKTGLVIPSWFEADIHVFGKDDPEHRQFSIKYSNDYVDVSKSHDSIQFLNFAKDTGKNIKINSPWAIKTKSDIGFAWSEPTWSMRDSFKHLTLLPAVVNFKYQHHSHINFFIEVGTDPVTITIPPLTPLVMLHPLTEKEVELKTHLVSDIEYKRIFSTEDLILNRNIKDEANEFERKKRLTNKIEDSNKCPFKE